MSLFLPLMKAGEMMDKDPLIIDPNEVLVNVINKLQRKEVGFVYDGENYYGGVTQLSILKKRINLQKMKAKTAAVKTPKLSLDTPIEDIARYMIESNFFYLPVFENEKLIGEVGYWKVLEFGKEFLKDYKASHVMSRDVITIPATDTVGKAIALMRKHKISHIPVVDKKGKVVGILTAKDIILKVISPRDRQRYGDMAGGKIISLDTPIREIVEPIVPVVFPEASLPEVIDVMKMNNFTAAIVMEENLIKGIITRKDILELLSEKPAEENLKVTISSNFPIDKEYIMYYVDKLWNKFSKFLQWGLLFVYVKREGRPPGYRYIVRLKLRAHPGFWVSKAEDYLFDIALRDAFDILEMEILKEKEEFLNRPEVVEL